MTKLFADNASTTLQSAIGPGNTTITVVDASRFPTPSSSDHFDITITQSSNETSWEIFKVSSRSGNVLTIDTPIVGTWNPGSKVEIRWTAEHAMSAANPAISGACTLDFGSGAQVATYMVLGQSDINDNSQINAWIQGVDSSDHNAYEHMIAPIRVTAGNIIPGQGFEVMGVSDVQLTGQFGVQWVRTQ
jgi:hypothetical protein